VGQLTAGLPDLPVAGVVFKNWAIRFPEVAEALAPAVFLRNPTPEPGAGLCRTVSDDECYNLSGPAAQGYPQPPLVRPFSDVCPAFVELKDVILLSWPEPIGY